MEKETIIYGVNNFYDLKANSWSGAIQTLDRVEELGKEEELLNVVNAFIGDGVDETKLNDYIWFDDGAEYDLKEYYNINLWEED